VTATLPVLYDYMKKSTRWLPRWWSQCTRWKPQTPMSIFGC